MHLPANLRKWVEQRAGALPQHQLERAAAALSDHYRHGKPLHLNPEERTAAYLVTRFPATYAAAVAMWTEVRGRMSQPVRSIVDIGAGCGAATLAAFEVFGEMEATLIELDAEMTAAGREILPSAKWIRADVRSTELPAADVVIAAYAIGEMGAQQRAKLASRMWSAAQTAAAVMEPGSMAGFHVVQSIRDQMLHLDGHMIAPCPHQRACPMPEDDWCHFAARLERSALHRRAKHGSLSYEDEKYTYAAIAKAPSAMATARIVRRPVHHPGLIELTVCGEAGIAKKAWRKRNAGEFRAARKAAWGDAWENERNDP